MHLLFENIEMFLFLRQLRPRLFTFVTTTSFFLSFLAFANVLVTLHQSLQSTNPGYDILSWKILLCPEAYKRHWQWRTQPKWHSMIICGETQCCLFLGYLHFNFSQYKPWTFWCLELKVWRLISLVLSVVCFSTYNVLFFKKL